MASYADPPTLRQDAAETVLTPEEGGEGNWVGAPAVHDYRGERLLAVRERTPDRRGHTVRLARVDDGLTEVCRLTADDLGVVSVERPALATDPATGRLVVYLPVDHGANQWTIRRLAPVEDPRDLAPGTATDVLTPTAGTTDAVTVKDPYVLTVGGRYYMFYAGHDGVSEQAHLATSADGVTWERAGTGPVLGRGHWHDHHTRVSCVLPAPDAPVWTVFYEGSSATDHGETWNLRTAVGVSHDLESVLDTSPGGPRYSAGPDGVGVDAFATLRYLDAVETADGYRAYYEAARGDGSFELRRAPLTHD